MASVVIIEDDGGIRELAVPALAGADRTMVAAHLPLYQGGGPTR